MEQLSTATEQIATFDPIISLKGAVEHDPTWYFLTDGERRATAISSLSNSRSKKVSAEEFNGLVDLLGNATEAADYFTDVNSKSDHDPAYAALVKAASTQLRFEVPQATSLEELGSMLKSSAKTQLGLPSERSIRHHRILVRDGYQSFKQMFKNASDANKKEAVEEYKNPFTMNGNLAGFVNEVLAQADAKGLIGIDYGNYIAAVDQLAGAANDYAEFVRSLVTLDLQGTKLTDQLVFDKLGIITQRILIHVFSLYTLVVAGAMDAEGRYIPTPILNILLGQGSSAEQQLLQALRELSAKSQRDASSSTKSVSPTRTVGGLKYKPFRFTNYDDYDFGFIHFSSIVNAVDGKLQFDVDAFFDAMPNASLTVLDKQDSVWGDTYADLLGDGSRLGNLKRVLLTDTKLRKLFLSQGVENPPKGQNQLLHDAYLLSHWLGNSLWLDDVQLKGTMAMSADDKKRQQRERTQQRAAQKKKEVMETLASRGSVAPSAIAQRLRQGLATTRSRSPSPQRSGGSKASSESSMGFGTEG